MMMARLTSKISRSVTTNKARHSRQKRTRKDQNSQKHPCPKVEVDHIQVDIVAILVAMAKVVGSMLVGNGEMTDANGIIKSCQDRLASCGGVRLLSDGRKK